MPRAKYWFFTYNNYTPEGLEKVRDFINDPRCAYLAFGHEVGSQRGTPHLQGHLELHESTRHGYLNERLPIQITWLVRQGSFEQAEEYCRKEGQYESFGTRISKGRGKRTDLDALQDSLNRGSSLRQISNEHFGSYMRYRRSIVAYKNLHAKKRMWKCSVIIYWGSAGIGKSRLIYDNCDDLDNIWEYPGKGWFDGYDGQEIVLFDEFTGADFPLAYLLKLLDRYPMKVPVKGDFVNWAPKEIYITSNKDPDMWYPAAFEEHQRALKRRFTNVVFMG